MNRDLFTIDASPSQPSWSPHDRRLSNALPHAPPPLAMSKDLQSAVRTATLELLKPLARFLLEARIGIGELNALARRAYVQAAVQNAAAGTYRVNVSRI